MATVNFSVPVEVRDEFNRCFAGENKSAILTQLMRDAIEKYKRQQRRAQAIERLLAFRQMQPPINQQQIRESREALRE